MKLCLFLVQCEAVLVVSPMWSCFEERPCAHCYCWIKATLSCGLKQHPLSSLMHQRQPILWHTRTEIQSFTLLPLRAESMATDYLPSHGLPSASGALSCEHTLTLSIPGLSPQPWLCSQCQAVMHRHERCKAKYIIVCVLLVLSTTMRAEI